MPTKTNTPAENEEPIYAASVREEVEPGNHIDGTVYLSAQFDRFGHLAGFARNEWDAEWLLDPLMRLQLEEAYEEAARGFGGREPTRGDLVDGVVRMATVIWEKRTCDQFGRWTVRTRTVTIEASF